MDGLNFQCIHDADQCFNHSLKLLVNNLEQRAFYLWPTKYLDVHTNLFTGAYYYTDIGHKKINSIIHARC
jgi:hypothetical protein